MIKIWSTALADKKFSEWIRKRDGKCVLCKRTEPQVKLTCSHYWGRFASSTRYDPKNCDSLCFGCHFRVENAKQGEYREWKIKHLGLAGYKALEKRYYQEKTTRRDSILKVMELLQNDIT